MTLVSAMANASGAATVDWFVPGNYGVTADAYLSHVAIVRGSLSQPQLSVVDYGAIIKGKTRDVLLEPGDIILLCSDGLNTMLSDDEIKQVLERGGDLTPLAYQMVAEANRRGGVDNITVVLVSMAP